MADQPIIIKKKKVHGGHAHHGGSWKVAYADFVTAMMAFFMVMWIMGLSEDVKQKIQGYFNDPLGFNKNQPRSKSIMSVPGMPTPRNGDSKLHGDNPYDKEEQGMRQTAQKLKQALEGNKEFAGLLKDVSIQMTPEGLLIEMVETRGTVFFESGSSQIRPEAKRLVAGIAPVLSSSGHKIVVQGHTDAQPFAGSPMGNWGLSTERALSLQQTLLGCGIPESQVREVAGYAATRLRNPQQPFDVSNRRVTILLPRQYKADDSYSPPKETLRAQISQEGKPQAVEVAPGGAELYKKKLNGF